MRLAVRIVVAALLALVLASTQARATPRAEVTQTFQIAAQPLAQALLEFSRQADVIVTAPAELVRNKRAPEIRGELTSAAALSRLLRGSSRLFDRFSCLGNLRTAIRCSDDVRVSW